MPLKKGAHPLQPNILQLKLLINANCKVKKPSKNYMSYIRKKANMQGGQASKLKQSILLELVDGKHPVYYA
jgi:hypothetical protein